MSGPGFFRRNKWGLIAVLPVTALFSLVALDSTGYFDRPDPTTAISGPPADWVSYSGAKLRLIGMAETTGDLFDASARTYHLPAGMVAWKAIVEFDTDDQAKLAGCRFLMEDNAGRLFGSQPDELAGASIPAPSCTAEDRSLHTYQVSVFFVSPAGVNPVAVHVTRPEVAGYARLVGA